MSRIEQIIISDGSIILRNSVGGSACLDSADYFAELTGAATEDFFAAMHTILSNVSDEWLQQFFPNVEVVRPKKGASRTLPAVKIADMLRSDMLAKTPEAHLGEACYTIREVVENDCYGLLKVLNGLFSNETAWVLDIGANYGTFSMFALRAIASAGLKPYIRAFEPCLATFKTLVDVTSNTSIYPECVAAGLGGRGYYPPNPQEPMKAKRGVCQVANTYEMPLSEMARGWEDSEGPLLIKMDIEGGEYRIFGAALPSDIDLLQGCTWLSMEVHHRPEIIEGIADGTTLVDFWTETTKRLMPHHTLHPITMIDPNTAIVTLTN